MKLTNRYAILALIFAVVLPFVATGCILVVEEDDDYDRHRHLHGSEWTLEVVFYRTQTVQAADRGVDLQFDDNGRFSGEASCGDVSGLYEVNDNGGFTVSTVEYHENCRGEPITELFADGMRAARTYQADEASLRIATQENGYLTFSSK